MAKKKKEPENTIKVHMPVMLPVELLSEHVTNSNKQDKHMFEELRKNIREHGFDESLTVIPEGEGYRIVSGNHRYRAGKAEGMFEFPCVVRPDWNDIDAEIQSVRRNYVRGTIDKDKFTLQVNKLANEHNLLMGDIMAQMGFADEEAFAEYYNSQKKQEEKIAEATVSAPAVRLIDDLGSVISAIYEQYGDTVPQSFIIFPAGGKNHMFVASTPALKKKLEEIAIHCLANKLDINIALGGLLAIGMAHSNFIKDTTQTEQAGNIPGNSDIEIIK